MKNKTIIISMIIMFIMMITSITVSAAALINSNEVMYDNTKSGLTSTNVQGAVDELYSAATDYSSLNNKIDGIIDKIYPVGSIYISAEDDTKEKVESRFGGTWERYAEGRTIIGVGTSTDTNGNVSTYTQNQSGGNSLISLKISNLPSHNHTYTPSGTVSSTFTGTKSNTGNNSVGHTHSYSGTTSGSGEHSHNVTNYNGTPLYSQNAQSPGGGAGMNYAWAFGNTYPLKTDSVSNHTHTFSGSTGGQNTNHTHSYTPSGTVSSTFTGTKANTNSTGSGVQFDIQNPYVTTYMYKRVK